MPGQIGVVVLAYVIRWKLQSYEQAARKEVASQKKVHNEEEAGAPKWLHLEAS